MIQVRGRPSIARQLRSVNTMVRLLSTMKSKPYLFVGLFFHDFDNCFHHILPILCKDLFVYGYSNAPSSLWRAGNEALIQKLC